MSHIPPLDPNVAARKGFRESEERLKRFWASADVRAEGEGWLLLLDGRAPKTPAGNRFVLPTEAAARWCAKSGRPKANTSTLPPCRRRDWRRQPSIGSARPVSPWPTRLQPSPARTCFAIWLMSRARWLRNRSASGLLGATGRRAPTKSFWSRSTGLCTAPQDPAAIARVRALALGLDDFTLTGLAMAVPLLGSAVLGLAVQQGAIGGEAAFDISRIDEAFQERRWGVDSEAAERTSARRAEAALLERWFKALT